MADAYAIRISDSRKERILHVANYIIDNKALQVDAAREFKMAQNSVCRDMHDLMYVDKDLYDKVVSVNRERNTGLTDERYNRILEEAEYRLATCASQQETADRFGVSQRIICRDMHILRDKNYKKWESMMRVVHPEKLEPMQNECIESDVKSQG